MSKILFYIAGSLFLLTMFSSCTTYYFTPSSLNKQLSQIDTNSIHEVYDFRFGVLGVVAGGKHFYNPIKPFHLRDIAKLELQK